MTRVVWARRCLFGVVAGAWIAALAACQYGISPDPTAPSSTTTAAPTPTGTSSSSLTYTTDIKPILAGDCVSCHGPSTRAAGVDLSTYAGVMRTVTPGNANSLLILVTRSGGLMYGEFRGSASTKAGKISDWIVKANAAQ